MIIYDGLLQKSNSNHEIVFFEFKIRKVKHITKGYANLKLNQKSNSFNWQFHSLFLELKPTTATELKSRICSSKQLSLQCKI